jgi:hypothetical protein
MATTIDLRDPRAVVEGVYTIISGAAGAPRDWDLFRTLYLPGAHLLRTTVEAGVVRPAHFSVEEYIANVTELFAREPFHEFATGYRFERFGAVASVRSAYEAKRGASDPQAFKRGVNFVQLFHDGSRWWIASVVWDNEREGVVERAA